MKSSTEHVTFYDRYWQRKRYPLLQVSKNLKLKEFVKLARAKTKPGAQCLDAGCGDGQLAKKLARHFETSAFDFSSQTILENQRRIPSVSFFVRDALSAPDKSEKETFDLVTCMDVIEHVAFEYQERLIRNLAGYLSHEGVLIISTPDRTQALRYRKDRHEPEEVFLRRYEGQPLADCLTSSQFDHLLEQVFRIEEAYSIVPSCPSRPLDLLWKSGALLLKYTGVNRLSGSLKIPGRYMIRVCRKNSYKTPTLPNQTN